MFSCFSKKKKQIPNPIQLSKCNTDQITHQQSTQQTNHHYQQLTLPIDNNIKRSKFTPIHHTQQLTPSSNSLQQPISISLNKIDDILEQQLDYCSQSFIEEETANFGRYVQEVPETPHFDNIIIPDEEDNTFNSQFKNYFVFKDTKSISMSSQSAFSDLPEEEEITFSHSIPKSNNKSIHTFTELTNKTTSKSRRSRRRTKQPIHSEIINQIPQYEIYDSKLEQWALDTTITLQNFKLSTQRIYQKIEEQLQQNDFMNQTLEQAENSFYCSQGNLVEQFSRAVISNQEPSLPKRIFQKMNPQQKNTINSKGYTCVQLLVLKTIQTPSFLQFSKDVIYKPQTNLECRGPSGWTPLQQALSYRNIALATHIFKASYFKKQQQYTALLSSFADILKGMHDFQLELSVKVDSFIPLVGNLTPNDTLKIIKVKQKLQLNYSLVGYQFPTCKRRDMQILFDGSKLWGINNSKKIYCDLLEQLDHQEMVLMIQDILTSEIKRSWPIIHTTEIKPTLSLFQNPITQQIADKTASLHSLNICYTSTSNTRQPKSQHQQLNYMSNYSAFQQRKESVSIKEKNRNKKVQLELWLCKDFGIELQQLLSILEILSMGNSLISQWSKFLKNQVGQTISKRKQFPVKIDIPLNYSLYFNIQFTSFKNIADTSTTLCLAHDIQQVKRKDFQGTLQSKEKRSIFIQAYT